MSKNNILKVSSILAFLTAAGCQSNLERHDGVTASAGDHLAVNEAKMVEDPWKRNAYNTDIQTDGRRSSDITKRYRQQHHVKDNQASPSSPGFGLPEAPGTETN